RSGPGRRGDRVARGAGRDRRRLPHSRYHGPVRREVGGGGHDQSHAPQGLRSRLTPDARLLLKVHRSNFQVTGFTTEVPATELAELARAQGVASLYDLGSGLLLDLA